MNRNMKEYRINAHMKPEETEQDFKDRVEAEGVEAISYRYPDCRYTGKIVEYENGSLKAICEDIPKALIGLIGAKDAPVVNFTMRTFGLGVEYVGIKGDVEE